MSGASPTRGEILNLFRSLLIVSRKFPDYNIREYAKRRTIHGFRQTNHFLTQVPFLTLEIAQRQALVYSLYALNAKSIMDLPYPN